MSFIVRAMLGVQQVEATTNAAQEKYRREKEAWKEQLEEKAAELEEAAQKLSALQSEKCGDILLCCARLGSYFRVLCVVQAAFVPMVCRWLLAKPI